MGGQCSSGTRQSPIDLKLDPEASNDNITLELTNFNLVEADFLAENDCHSGKLFDSISSLGMK